MRRDRAFFNIDMGKTTERGRGSQNWMETARGGGRQASPARILLDAHEGCHPGKPKMRSNSLSGVQFGSVHGRARACTQTVNHSQGRFHARH